MLRGFDLQAEAVRHEIHYDSGAMRRLFLSSAFLCATAAILVTAQAAQPVTIRAGRLIDGRGGVQQDVVVRLDGAKIVSCRQGQRAGDA